MRTLKALPKEKRRNHLNEGHQFRGVALSGPVQEKARYYRATFLQTLGKGRNRCGNNHTKPSIIMEQKQPFRKRQFHWQAIKN
jgi:hypothetical protein